MADLTTSWMGLELRSPLVVGASPLADDVELARRLSGAGAGAIVMRSVFEEQITAEQLAVHRLVDSHIDTNAEASSFWPESGLVPIGAEGITSAVRRCKQELDIPVVASLNGVTPGGWTQYAAELRAAGADAIELNLYEVATECDVTSDEIERRQLDVVQAVVGAVDVPVSVKLSPFYASVPSFVRRLEEVGAAGVTLFNRFYQPDVDPDTLDVDRRLIPSTPSELPLRLHALALLHGRVSLSLAATGGVHHGIDAAKAILCGADVVQLVSVLLAQPVEELARVLAELERWLEHHGYASGAEARGATAISRVADPGAWERLNYVQVLDGWTRHSRRR